MNRVTFSIPTVGVLSLSLFAGCGEGPPAPFCGDGVVDAGEECDDANNIDTDECPSTCLEATCGDSFVQAGQEECDDANNIDGDTCTNDCTNAECGDGIIFNQAGGVEGCDDQNNNNNDGCLNDCEVDPIINDFEITTRRGVELVDYNYNFCTYVSSYTGGCTGTFIPCVKTFDTTLLSINENLSNIEGIISSSLTSCADASVNGTNFEQTIYGYATVVTPKVQYNIVLFENATAFVLDCDMNAGFDLNCIDQFNLSWVLDAP
jgi:cysteine-rich repeat protein